MPVIFYFIFNIIHFNIEKSNKNKRNQNPHTKLNAIVDITDGIGSRYIIFVMGMTTN